MSSDDESSFDGGDSDFSVDKKKKKAPLKALDLNKEVKVPAAKKKAAPKKAAEKPKEDATDEIDPTAGGRTNSAKKALANKFEKLTPREHVLKRPDTYVGSTESITQPMWVLEGKRMIERPLTFVPALYKIFDEILVNAADNKRRDASMKEIRVDFEQETGRITVRNDGKGIPVEKHEKHDLYIPEMIFGHLLTGENFNDEEERVVGGRNGYGAKLANIFSTTFKIETNDKASDQLYTQVWTKNMEICGKAKITKAKAKDYTEVSFIPDYSRFGMSTLDDDMMALFRKRVYDIAGVTDKSVKVYLNGELISCNTFEKYVKLYTEAPAATEDGGANLDTSTLTSPGGNGGKNKRTVVFSELNDRWQIAATCSKDGSPTQVSFVNSICTYKGGQHVQYLQEKICKYVQEFIEKKHKAQSSVVKPQQIKNHLWLFVNALIVNPAFDSQTKENLTTRSTKFGPKEFLPEIPDDVLAKIVKNTGIVENVLYWASQKQMKDLKRVGGKKKSSLMDIPKLDDANNAGGKKSEDCTLILTEGDSAKTLALSGISVVGRDDYGVFPLKGKLLNVRDAAHSQIMKNMEIQNLMKILGLKVGEKYDSTKSLRYGHVMIMTDQDQDGSHIKGLVFNFFHFYFPTLLQIPGFLQVFVTPLVKVTNKNKTLAFYSLREYDDWKSKVGKEAREKLLRRDPRASEELLKACELSALKSWRVKYYKGLGTNSSKEAQEYFAKIDTHSIEMTFDQHSGDALELAFAKSRVDDRKQWLLKHDPETFTPVDFKAKLLDYKHFVDGELVLFSLADNVRSIPSVLDGFKPSQRKVLFACLKRNLVNEIKVSQLSGYVSEHAAYHHGEESLSSTIVGMAQSFVGSNNIPLLHAGGAFGTRRLGGKDSASPRYIFTKLLKVTRTIFHPDDDALLKRVEDDGILVEPQHYVPVIPMILVNGSSGIGTGWSTEIPSYNPRVIIECIRKKLAGASEEAPRLVPYYHGFAGQIVEEIKPKKGPTGRFFIRGKFELDGEKLTISELPVGKWTGVYKEFLIEAASLEAPAAKPEKAGKGEKGAKKVVDKSVPFGRKTFPPEAIKEIRENHTDESVAFEITLSSEFASQLAEGGAEFIMSQFQLQTTISCSNMNGFDERGTIRKFETPEEILDLFFQYRLPFYEKRKAYLEQELAKEHEKLSSQARFVRMIVDGQLVLSKKKRKQVLSEIQGLGFPKWFKDKQTEETSPVDENEGENDEDQPEEEDETSGKGYDYLLSLTLWSLTIEKFKQLEQKAALKAKELEDLRKKTPQDLWVADLANLEAAMDELDQTESQIRKEQDAARGKAKRAGGKRKRPVAAKKKKAQNSSDEESDESSSEDDDDEDDDDFVAKKKKKPSPPKQKKPTSPPVVKSTNSKVITQDSLPQVVYAKVSKKEENGDDAPTAPKPEKKPAPKPKRSKVVPSSEEEEEDDVSMDDDDDDVPVVPKNRPARAATKKIIKVSSSENEDDSMEDVMEVTTPSQKEVDEDDEFAFTPEELPTKKKQPAAKKPVLKATSPVKSPSKPKSLRERLEAKDVFRSVRPVSPDSEKEETENAARPARAKARPKYVEEKDSILGDDDDDDDDVVDLASEDDDE